MQKLFHFLIVSILLPLIFFALFAKYGFNATDDGVVFSMARRLLFNQVPYIDFISIRPVGSAWLHILELVFAQQYLLLVGRFVFLIQIGISVYCFIQFAEFYTQKTFSNLVKICVSIVAYYLSINNFNLMPWPTTDAIFCIAVGTYLSIKQNKILESLGYLIVGYSVLCKQNFLPIIFIFPFIINKQKSFKCWIYLLLPSILFFEYLYFNHAIGAGINQMMAQSGFLFSLISNYFTNFYFYIGLLLGALFYFNFIEKELKYSQQLDLLYVAFLIFLPVFLLTTLLLFKSTKSPHMLLVGYAISITIILFYNKKVNQSLLIFFAIVLAICSSISLGINSPIMVSGIIFLCLFYGLINPESEIPIFTKSIVTVALICTVLIYFIRSKNIYREKSKMSEICYKLDNVVAGASGVYTNKNNYEMLKELDSLTINKQNYVIVNDFAFHWALTSFQNHLPLDWPAGDEMPNNIMFDKVWHTIQLHPNIQTAIVQKYYNCVIADTLIPINKGIMHYNLTDSIQANYIKTFDGKYFTIYKVK